MTVVLPTPGRPKNNTELGTAWHTNTFAVPTTGLTQYATVTKEQHCYLTDPMAMSLD